MTISHEFSGTIVQLGSQVQNTWCKTQNIWRARQNTWYLILDARPNSLERSKFPVLDSYIFSCGFSDDPVHNDSNIPTFEGPQTVHYKTCVLWTLNLKQAEKRFKVGDRVGVDPNRQTHRFFCKGFSAKPSHIKIVWLWYFLSRPCHQCQFCVRGQVHFCQVTQYHLGGLYLNC